MRNDQTGFRKLEQRTGRTLSSEGREYLYFGGTAYLGLNTHPEAIRLYMEGVQKYGLNIGTSRTNNVQLDIYSRAEEYLAHRFGFEEGMVVSSGFLAAQLVANVMADEADILYAPGAHPALWPKSVSPASFLCFDEWAFEIVQHINKSPQQVFVVASDTFASIRPSYYDFTPFESIEETKEVHFILDNSHGFGIWDNPSILRLRNQNRQNLHFILVGSLAKGIGVDAGVILGDQTTLTRLRRSPMYVGASPPSPAGMHLLEKGRALYERQLAKLRERMWQFEQSVPHGYLSISGFPVYCFYQSDLYSQLAEKGIIISSFSYPSPEDTPLNRVVVNSEHTAADIDRLVRAIKEII